jgi:hypothetical protein
MPGGVWEGAPVSLFCQPCCKHLTEAKAVADLEQHLGDLLSGFLGPLRREAFGDSSFVLLLVP